jgi:hypothetical protein
MAQEFSVNPNKTELVLCTKKKKLEGFVEPTVLNTVLHTTEPVKYSAFILDAKLAWKGQEVQFNW